MVIVNRTPCLIVIIIVHLLIYSIYSLEQSDDHYSVVIDAGSSGSRIRVYTWTKLLHETELPEISEIFNKKNRPGISSYVNDYDTLQKHLISLIDDAGEYVPLEAMGNTPIYLLATAGMRLIDEELATATMDQIDTIFKDTDINPFYYESANSRILSGEEEGAFAWIAANYLSGFFDEDPDNDVEQSFGVLECGGASTQIAFLTHGDILANKYPIKIAGMYYSLYVHSYLQYGYDYPSILANADLAKKHGEDEIEQPCMLEGYEKTEDYDGRSITFKGSSDPSNCTTLMDNIVYEASDYRCHPKPCAIGAVYQPSISDDMQFYAIGSFMHVPSDLDLLSEDSAVISPNEIKDKAHEYCKMSFQEAIDFGKKEEYINQICVSGIYVPLLLTKAYGFDGDSDKIHFVKKVNGEKPDWTLGSVLNEIYKMELPCYAISLSSLTTGASSQRISLFFIFTQSLLMLCFRFFR